MPLYGTTDTNYTNVNLNDLSSTYASTFTHDTTNLVSRVVHDMIYDGTRQQFYDMAILDMVTPELVSSDEFFFAEKTYGRSAAVVTDTCVTGATQVVKCTDTSMVGLDYVVCYPDNTKGIVYSITEDVEFNVRGISGATVPQVVATDLLQMLAPTEADAASDIRNFFRMSTTERYNYVQLYVKAMKFGKVEKLKYERAGTFKNFLSMNREEFFNQCRIDRSNIYWNGTRGEATLTGGEKAKLAGGIYPTMIAAGCPVVSATTSTVGTALESAAISTNHMAYGGTRFAYMTPELHLVVSKYYKDLLTRYTPDSKVADLMLTQVRLGDSNIVLVPMSRFKDTASFPTHFQGKILLLDQKSIIPVYLFPEEFKSTLNRSNGSLNNFDIDHLSMSFSQKYINPLGGAIIDVAGY